MQGAIGYVLSCCLLCVSLKRDLHPSTADGCAGYLISRVNLFRNLLMSLLSRDAQTSPDKSVNCRYTTAAFTVSPESVGLRHVVLTCPDDGLVCCFCSSAHSFALRLPSDPSSRRRPCLRLVLLLVSITMNTIRFSYRGLSPHKLTPMPGVHQALETDSPSGAAQRHDYTGE